MSSLKPKVDASIEKTIARKYGKREFEFLAGKPAYGYLLSECDGSLAAPIWDLLDRGGKRWRPALMLLVIGGFGKKPENFLQYACVPEVVHNGSLMVDDIEDNSDLRRGKPCTHHLFGVDIAINAGNAMYYLPLLPILKNRKSLGDKKYSDLMDAYVQEMINLSIGQGTDIYWHKGLSKAVSEGQYLQMCAFKTGTLARMAAKMGAILADATSAQVVAAGKFAEAIGVAFQIQDDVLNLVGDEGEYGKEIGGDISEGKQTLMVIHAISKAKPGDKKRLLQILAMHSKDKAIVAEAIGIMRECGSIEYAQARAKKMVASAWAGFEKHLKPSQYKRDLQAFASFLIERRV